MHSQLCTLSSRIAQRPLSFLFNEQYSIRKQICKCLGTKSEEYDTGGRPDQLEQVKENNKSILSENIHWTKLIGNENKYTNKINFSSNEETKVFQKEDKIINYLDFSHLHFEKERQTIKMDEFIFYEPNNAKEKNIKKRNKRISETQTTNENPQELDSNKAKTFYKMNQNNRKSKNNEEISLINENMESNAVKITVVDDERREEHEDLSHSLEKMRREESISVLEPPLYQEDIDMIAPYIRPAFNCAAYINRSPTLQKLVDLGVDLSEWENKRGVLEEMLRLEFETDIQPFIRFMVDKAIPASELGNLLSHNPLLLKEDLSDLEARFNYLRSKNFTEDMIRHMVLENYTWLNKSVLDVDEKLGFLQRLFKLSGNEVRQFIVGDPRLLNARKSQLKINYQRIVDFGFEDHELKIILLSTPKIMRQAFVQAHKTLEYLLDEMNIPKELIVKFNTILTEPTMLIKERHEFLKYINRCQFDPAKPNYISLLGLVEKEDDEFCSVHAKCSLELYYDYLKTI